MILKYKVPENQLFRYDGKKIIYCKVKKYIDLGTVDKRIYLVNMINFKNLSTIFSNGELKRLNIFDKIKLWKEK